MSPYNKDFRISSFKHARYSTSQVMLQESIYSKMNFFHSQYDWENLGKKAECEHSNIFKYKPRKVRDGLKNKILYDVGYML